MNESELVRELSRKASVPEDSAEAVLNAVRDLIRYGKPAMNPLTGSDPTDPRLIDDIIARAETHPLGIDLLLNGHLGSVAATFGAHAFTVEAARARLRKEQRNP